MKLDQGIQVTLGSESAILRPSLRYALALEGRSGGIPGLIADLQDGSLTAYCDILRPHFGGGKFFTQQVFDAMNELQAPLIEFVFALTGIDPDAKHDASNSDGASVPLREHLISFFKIGTGWLGWTPEQTLDATVYEIRLAYEGRIELLKAIFGSPDPKPDTDGMSLDDKLKSAFGTFKTTKVKPRHKRGKAAA